MKAGVEQDFRKVSNAQKKVSNAPEKVSNALKKVSNALQKVSNDTKNKDWNKNEETINN